jgi:hypothetical protein
MWRRRPRVEVILEGGAEGGASLEVSTACSQASQWGLQVRPGKGFGSLERWRGGVSDFDGDGGTAVGSDGHSRESMRNSHTSAINTTW